MLLMSSSKVLRLKGNCNYHKFDKTIRLYKISLFSPTLYKVQFKNQEGRQKFTTASLSNVWNFDHAPFSSEWKLCFVFLKSLPQYSSNPRIVIHVYEEKSVLAWHLPADCTTFSSDLTGSTSGLICSHHVSNCYSVGEGLFQVWSEDAIKPSRNIFVSLIANGIIWWITKLAYVIVPGLPTCALS